MELYFHSVCMPLWCDVKENLTFIFTIHIKYKLMCVDMCVLQYIEFHLYDYISQFGIT